MKVSSVSKPEGCKLLRVDADIVDSVVITLSIRGDFFAVPEEGFERMERRLAGTRVEDIARRFDELAAEEGVEPYGITGEGLAFAVGAAIHGA